MLNRLSTAPHRKRWPQHTPTHTFSSSVSPAHTFGFFFNRCIWQKCDLYLSPLQTLTGVCSCARARWLCTRCRVLFKRLISGCFSFSKDQQQSEPCGSPLVQVFPTPRVSLVLLMGLSWQIFLADPRTEKRFKTQQVKKLKIAFFVFYFIVIYLFI